MRWKNLGTEETPIFARLNPDKSGQVAFVEFLDNPLASTWFDNLDTGEYRILSSDQALHVLERR